MHMKVSFIPFGTFVNPEKLQKYKTENSFNCNIVHPLYQPRPKLSVSFRYVSLM